MKRTAPTQPPQDSYLRVTDFAKRFKVTRQHVYNMINRGDIKAVKVGGAVRIPAQVADEYERTILATAGL